MPRTTRNTITLLLCLIAAKAHSQIEVVEKKIDNLDTLNTRSVAIDLDFQTILSHEEMDAYPSLVFVHTARCNYLFNHSDFELNFKQILDHSDDGLFYYTHYVMLSSGLYKYRPVSAEKTVVRPLYVEPLFIFQNNTNWGLQWRFQTGALLHPLKMIYPKIKVNLGMGFVYDWSSWEVNNMEEINDVSPELREKILFINSHTKLKNDMYQHHNEFRPMLLLNVNYKPSERLGMKLTTSYQQSLVSPFSEEVKAAYPELRKIYPYLITQFSINAKLRRGFALKSSIMVDYENNNLSLYNSSWEYRVLLGVAWSFSNQRD
ncbi:MAG: hypothetical protein FWG79_02065 [Bacteroidales bacterium]|nr:hypothetical protein [Bacteroidales bacterium]